MLLCEINLLLRVGHRIVMKWNVFSIRGVWFWVIKHILMYYKKTWLSLSVYKSFKIQIHSAIYECEREKQHTFEQQVFSIWVNTSSSTTQSTAPPYVKNRKRIMMMTSEICSGEADYSLKTDTALTHSSETHLIMIKWLNIFC